MQHFVDLLQLDCANGGLRAAPRLTPTHVNPNNLQRMNVRYAAQLFSNSSADALQFYIDQHAPTLSDASTTVSFVRWLNKLFDVLNARLPREALHLRSSKFEVLSCVQLSLFSIYVLLLLIEVRLRRLLKEF